MNMMTLFAPVILVAASATVTASEGDDLCAALASAAGTTMEARQIGIPATKLLALVEPYEDEGVRVLLRGMILKAYESPRFNTEKYRKEAVAEFQNETLVNCLKFVEASQ